MGVKFNTRFPVHPGPWAWSPGSVWFYSLLGRVFFPRLCTSWSWQHAHGSCFCLCNDLGGGSGPPHSFPRCPACSWHLLLDAPQTSQASHLSVHQNVLLPLLRWEVPSLDTLRRVWILSLPPFLPPSPASTGLTGFQLRVLKQSLSWAPLSPPAPSCPHPPLPFLGVPLCFLASSLS